ncbi:MAG: hypothetical protein AAFY76_22445 [Cyanobacteria bacterium J06649_11]
MRAWVDDEILCLHREDVPFYKRNGSVVRNTFFWALKSISGNAPRDREWEFETEVWVALSRMLAAFSEAGYLPLSETILEFAPSHSIPEVFRSVATIYEKSEI